MLVGPSQSYCTMTKTAFARIQFLKKLAAKFDNCFEMTNFQSAKQTNLELH